MDQNIPAKRNTGMTRNGKNCRILIELLIYLIAEKYSILKPYHDYILFEVERDGTWT
jgi:hypothetical protein